MYQAKAQIIDLIAMHPTTTITDLGNILKKTTFICSQIVRKLKEKELVKQSRNRDNSRLCNLTLTESGIAQTNIATGRETVKEACDRIIHALKD